MAGVGSKPTGGILSIRAFYRNSPSSWTLNAAFGLDIHQWKTSVIHPTQKVVRSKLTVISVSLALPPSLIPIPCSSAAERLTHRPLPSFTLTRGTSRGWLSPYKRKVTGSKPFGGIHFISVALLSLCSFSPCITGGGSEVTRHASTLCSKLLLYRCGAAEARVELPFGVTPTRSHDRNVSPVLFRDNTHYWSSWTLNAAGFDILSVEDF